MTNSNLSPTQGGQEYSNNLHGNVVMGLQLLTLLGVRPHLGPPPGTLSGNEGPYSNLRRWNREVEGRGRQGEGEMEAAWEGGREEEREGG